MANIQVQIATEAAGKSPEEVERFVTIPIEIAMTGLPGMTDMRSLNKPGLSLITLVFTDGSDLFRERQMISERLSELRDRMPEGVTPVLGPITNALGEVYQYTLEMPSESEAHRPLTRDELIERRTLQDWVVRPLLRSIPGVAEINSTGGFVKQYETLVDPQKLHYYNLTINDVRDALAQNNANAGGGVLRQHAEQYLIRSVGLVRDLDDIRNIVLKETKGTPVYIRDVAEVRIGTEVRYGAMIKNGYTEAVGGVVLMTSGGNAKEIVSRVKERVDGNQSQTHDPRRAADRSLLRPLATGGCRHPHRDRSAGRGRAVGRGRVVSVSGRSALQPYRQREPCSHAAADLSGDESDRLVSQPYVPRRPRHRDRLDGGWFRGCGREHLCPAEPRTGTITSREIRSPSCTWCFRR